MLTQEQMTRACDAARRVNSKLATYDAEPDTMVPVDELPIHDVSDIGWIMRSASLKQRERIMTILHA